MTVATSVAKNTFFNSLATNFDLVANFFAGVTLARGLSADGYGLYSYLTWFLSVAVIVANMGLGDMLMRFVADAMGRGDLTEAKSLVRFALLLRAISAVIVCVGVLAFAGLWGRSVTEHSQPLYFVILAITIMPQVITNLEQSLFAGFQRYNYRTLVVLSMSPLRLAIVVGLMAMGRGVSEVLLANGLAYLVGLIVSVALMHRLIPLREIASAPPLAKELKNKALSYCINREFIYISGFLGFGTVAVLFVGMYLSNADVGFYSMADKLATMAMTLIPAVLTGVLVPTIAEQFGKGDLDRLKRIAIASSRYLAMLALPVAAAGIGLGEPIVRYLYGAEYAAAVTPMRILLVPAAFWTMADGLSAVILGLNRPGFLSRIGLLLACLNVGLTFTLTMRFGLLGAAIGTSIPRLLYLGLCARFLKNKAGIGWPARDVGKVAGASLVMGLAMFAIQRSVAGPIGLVLAVAVGFVLYLVLVLRLKALRLDDVRRFASLHGLLPSFLRKPYLFLLNSAGRLAGV